MIPSIDRSWQILTTQSLRSALKRSPHLHNVRLGSGVSQLVEDGPAPVVPLGPVQLGTVLRQHLQHRQVGPGTCQLQGTLLRGACPDR